MNSCRAPALRGVMFISCARSAKVQYTGCISFLLDPSRARDALCILISNFTLSISIVVPYVRLDYYSLNLPASFRCLEDLGIIGQLLGQ